MHLCAGHSRSPPFLLEVEDFQSQKRRG